MKVPKKYNVLVFPCGTEVGLEIHRSLSNCKEVKLFGCASIDNHHGELVFECYRQVKSVKDDCFLEEFNALLQEWNIDFIFPANPVVIDYLNFNRKYSSINYSNRLNLACYYILSLKYPLSLISI